LNPRFDYDKTDESGNGRRYYCDGGQMFNFLKLSNKNDTFQRDTDNRVRGEGTEILESFQSSFGSMLSSLFVHPSG
jgi:hypothetical protein